MNAAVEQTAPQTTAVLSEFNPKTGVVESKFVTALRKILIVEPPGIPPWPPSMPPSSPPDARDKEVLVQITDAFTVLFTRLEFRRTISPGAEKSAQRMVHDMLNGTGWPKGDDATFPVPAKFQTTDTSVKTFRRYEISCAVSLLMHAYNRSGGGGVGPKDWPPQGP